VICADGFQGLSKAFHYPIINFLFDSLKLLLILKMLGETLIRIPFSVIGRCSLLPTSHWLEGKCARINLPQATSGRIYRIKGGKEQGKTLSFTF